MTEPEHEDVPLVEGDDAPPDLELNPVEADDDTDTDDDTGDMDLTGQHFQGDPDDHGGRTAAI
jgi:hypothetical protein